MISTDPGLGSFPPQAHVGAGLTELALHTPHGVVLADAAGCVSWMNAGFENLTGATLAEAAGRPLTFFLQGDPRDGVAAEMSAAIETGLAFHREVRLHQQGGKLFWIRIDIEPVRSGIDATSAAGFVAMVRDVTEAVAARREMQDDNRRLSLAIESAHIGLWEWNVAEDLFWTSPQWWKYLGFDTPQAMIADDIADRMLHPEDVPQVRENRRAFFAEQKDQLVNEMRHRDGAGGWRWVLSTGRVTHRSEDGVATRVSGVYIDIDESRAASERISFAVHHDSLTGLANRAEIKRNLGQALKQSARSGEPFWVIVLGLDRFKSLNDTFGHATGDAVLKTLASRLLGAVRDVDVVARLGGDEFALLVRADRDDHAVSTTVALRLLDVVRQPYRVAGMTIQLAASIGIAKAPDHGSDADTLIRNADSALYKVKANGKNGFRFFDADLEEESRRRREVESELRKALGRDEFELHYQTISALTDRRVVGVEALLRWRHATLGMILPDRFIPIAEDTGLIVQIGEWVIRQACKDARNWPDEVTVAVNISAAQLGRGSLAASVMSALQDSGLSPSRLELEVTESIFLRDDVAVLHDLRQLRALGVRLVLDDFGTGYSSLGYLRRLPFNKIKIDRSFIADLGSDPHSSAVVLAVTNLAQSLGMASVAEGIETEHQAKLVTEAGCDLGQGYLFSRPSAVGALRFAVE